LVGTMAMPFLSRRKDEGGDAAKMDAGGRVVEPRTEKAGAWVEAGAEGAVWADV